MCGIFGYLGNRKAAPILLSGLKSLEYRGYDSFGFAVLDADNKEISIVKDKGKISELKNSAVLSLKGSIGISHTRWATHGVPSKENAHPHVDMKEQIAVVHNGIIENFQELKLELIERGICFVSETDSEVIAHLISTYYAGNLEEAVNKSMKHLIGAYGIAVISRDEEKIVCAKLGSPLVLGIGDNEYFISSDQSSIIPYTKNVIYLDDGEMLTISKEGYKLSPETDKKIFTIPWSIEEIKKGNYNHFMQKEIFEQPSSIENAIRGRITDTEIKISALDNLKTPARIRIVACGTSYYAGLVGKYFIEKNAKIPVIVDMASEFRYNYPIIEKDELVIAISQSGETADTKGAIEEAKRQNAETLGIINVVGSSIARMVDKGIFIHAGPEIGVASTKAFTGQVACLYLLAMKLAGKNGDEIRYIPELIRQTLDSEKEIEKIAVEFKDVKNFLFLGRGVNYPVAMEGALKLKEISYIHAEGYSAAEMKHGPIALIDENMPVIIIATNNGLVYNKIISNMQEVKCRKGKIIVIGNKGDKEIEKLADHIIYVPMTIDEFEPIINIIPLQLLAYHIAVKKGLDPDKPRNLAKAVTVE